MTKMIKMQNRKQSELSVITKAKELCSYILTVTEKSPKKLRFTLVAKLQNNVLDTLEALFLANEIYVGNREHSQIEKRREYQRDAMTHLKLLAYLAQLAMEQQCILPKQYEQITKQVYDYQNLLGAWMNSDRKRLGL